MPTNPDHSDELACTGCARPDTLRVTLVDGAQCCSWCEAWRHECEARAILSMTPLSARRAALYGIQESQMKYGKWTMVWARKGVQQVRGPEAVKRLEATMIALWRARQGAANDNAAPPSTSAHQG